MQPRSSRSDIRLRRFGRLPRPPLVRPAPPGRRALRAALATLAILAALTWPNGLTGQFRDARLPRMGELWFDLTGSLLNWDSQFAKDSPGPDIADGDREPLFQDFDGPLADRLFPGATSLIEGLNTDAAALGFDPVTPAEFSMGSLEFGTINTQRRRLELGFELGFLDRVSLEARVPLSFAEVEPSFAFDSASATVLSAATAIPTDFFTTFRTAVAALDGLIAGGTLAPGDISTAIGLRNGATAFADALERRIMELLLIPTGLSTAGMQMTSFVDSLVAGFELFDVTLPALPLPELATTADLGRFFTDAPLSGQVPGASERGWALGEIEFGARFGILDQITRPRTSDSPTRTEPLDEPPAGLPAEPPKEPREENLPVQGAGAEPPEEGELTPQVEAAPASDARFLRLRTSVGAKVRLPSGSPSLPPYEDASDFIGIPIGGGQMDVELAIYQDIALGERFFLSVAALYGLQLADELTLRIRPPDRPYAFEGTQALVRRDLGDYLQVRLAPQFQLSGGLWFGLEYGLWRKAVDRYEFGPTLPGVEDASALEIESEQRRTRFGFTVLFEPGEATRRPETRSRPSAAEADPEAVRAERLEHAERRVSTWRFAITARRAASGSGGQTPASFLVAVTMQAPIKIF